jgi:hypothetical protein
LFSKYDVSRARFSNYASQKVLKPKEDGLLADSDNYRTKVESKQLLDLGSTVEEKYGENTAWRL